MSLADKTLQSFLKDKHNVAYLDRLVSDSDVDDARVNQMDIPLFHMTASALKSKATSVSYFDDNFHNPKAFPLKNSTTVELTDYKVGSTSEVSVGNIFSDLIIHGKEIEPLHHKNPQKYQYHLDKNDIQDIAFKRLEFNNNYSNEYTKMFNEFYRQHRAQERQAREEQNRGLPKTGLEDAFEAVGQAIDFVMGRTNEDGQVEL